MSAEPQVRALGQDMLALYGSFEYYVELGLPQKKANEPKGSPPTSFVQIYLGLNHRVGIKKLRELIGSRIEKKDLKHVRLRYVVKIPQDARLTSIEAFLNGPANRESRSHGTKAASAR